MASHNSKRIGNRTFISAPAAAKKIGISRWTMNRWLANRKTCIDDAIEVLKDSTSGRYYIASDSVEGLLAQRFQKVS